MMTSSISQLSDKLDKISIIGTNRSRPSFDASSLPLTLEQKAIMEYKLAQRFDKSMRITETNSKLVQKDIEKR